MSLKTLTKTRWAIEADRVKIYPYGLFYMFSALFAIILGVLLFLYFKFPNAGGATPSLMLFFLLIVIYFWIYANTAIVFDNSSRIMQKKFGGVIPVKTVAFSKLHGINVVSNTMGGYNYRAFLKDDKYGKGTVVSSGYSKNTDTNAIAFTEEAVPVIHGFLSQDYGFVTEARPEPITSYKYYEQNGGTFTVKNRKVGTIILGILFFALGIYLATTVKWAEDTSAFGRYASIVGCFLFAFIFVNAAFTKVVFDQGAKTVQKTSLMGLTSKTYEFKNFLKFQTVRKTTNGVYTGTEIQMYLNNPNNNKNFYILLHHLRTSAQIERFLEETYSIMGL